MDMNINFPNLNIYLEHVGKSINLFGIEVAYYGIIIGIAMMIGIFCVQHEAKATGQNPDTYWDLAFFIVIFSIIGARLYYVFFSWDNYKDDLIRIFKIREGGLAIFGGVIAAVITVFIFSKIKQLSFPQLADTACIGLVVGQIIGRWGNFFNREAFGDYTNGIFAMLLPINAVRSNEITQEMKNNILNIGDVTYIQVHPTFLYESLWNIGVLIMLLIYKKHKKFEGEIFLMYLIGYGIGRSWIEGLRTDQLLLPILNIPVSQLLALVTVAVAVLIIGITRKNLIRKGRGDENAGDS
ncbi:prolipoprotein diacylglyceryl transferase [Anaerosacchariphilus polymeriproducens]|uniref:Phosphatidylglycerol--prolipoprotein diacylglyceryl transferase n=1 Tax=Anaerosacchariphilus polymeriproducens TaxID=1812858 RepID=A0A371B098_9FIRM|nr:prolipoprotein diacylglyceryl transferase [Anaerosacchariphilus polymeriproducens]RDU25274.1 prolipoprotein diacylglyceryl transferase [Anaerosacchariphilus polymeriproducens]